MPRIPATLLLMILLFAASHNGNAQGTPLLNAFAHNDYKHHRPLLDALDNGFSNIEADVFLKDSTLVVAHFCPLFRHSRNLETLYLRPLHERMLRNNGRIYAADPHPLILMIDIKSRAASTYRQLERVLGRYRDMLTRYENGRVIEGAVTVVLSGHKPYRTVESEEARLAFIDDDLRKVTRDTATRNVFTMASCRYAKLLHWAGKGPIPDDQRIRLCSYVAEAHSMGSKVRLWASPENRVVWNELLRCGVDLINTDHLADLGNYLRSGVTLAKVN